MKPAYRLRLYPEAVLRRKSLPVEEVDGALRELMNGMAGIDPEGGEIRRELDGQAARVVQHEIDHLNGILIIDHASVTESILQRKKLKELQRQGGG